VLDDGTRIEHELFVPRGAAMTVLSWRVAGAAAGMSLTVRPLLAGRDHDALHRENGVLRFDAAVEGERIEWRPYDGVPAIVALTNGTYRHDPHWHRGFVYDEERRLGLEAEEDLAAPGTLTFDLAEGQAHLVLAAHLVDAPAPLEGRRVGDVVAELRAAEGHRRAAFVSPLHRAADAYLVRRGGGQTILAGYPFATDRGRDTFVALRGICLATGRHEDARAILLEWADSISEGMLPGRFAERGESRGYDAADASLWYVIAVHDYLAATAASGRATPRGDRRRLQAAVEAILDGYAAGTRHGIRLDGDGLLAVGERGAAVTWMDAHRDGRPVTPRVGKPVELEALWLSAVSIASAFSERWPKTLAAGLRAFRERFWNGAGALHDVVDVDHRAGTVDPTLRPNQILAVGGLPHVLLEPGPARRVVDAVEARLWTPLGLRTRAPGEGGYAGRAEDEGAVHEGAAWPWLIGPFVEAWVRVRGSTLEARREARARFLEPLLGQLERRGLGHLSEVADGDAPHAQAGSPFQACSVSEALRLDRVVLGDDSRRPAAAPSVRPSPASTGRGTGRVERI
jgi:predicted glycogen debranching enzyme